MSTMNTQHGRGTATGEVQVMDHEYDGIQEFDNPTPSWWHILFIASCLFSVIYFFWYHMSPLSLSAEQAWQKQQIGEYRKMFGSLGELAGDEPTIQKMRGDVKLMAIAKGLFESNCAACHGRDGGGINGFNLTDDAYKNIKSIPDLFKVVTAGAANGAMPAWSAKLTQNERVLVAAYAANLRGTNPATPRGVDPNETVIPPWPR